MTIPFAQSNFAEVYEQSLVRPLFSPWAELLLDDVRLAAGDRMLDIACGTGIVSRRAKDRLGEEVSIVGVDLSAAMLAVARREGAGIDWREGDACALPLAEHERFDVVVCQQAIQFIPDRSAAVRQMRAALAPGGRIAVSAWRSDDELPVLRELRRVAERHVGPIVDRRHAFGDAGPLEELLRDAGFLDVRSKRVSRTIRFEDRELFPRLNARALVGMSESGRNASANDRERLVAEITRDSAEVVRSQSDEGGFAFEISANVATARA